MNEIKNSVQSTGTGKAAYVKPTMQVYELEVEGSILNESYICGIVRNLIKRVMKNEND